MAHHERNEDQGGRMHPFDQMSHDELEDALTMARELEDRAVEAAVLEELDRRARGDGLASYEREALEEELLMAREHGDMELEYRIEEELMRREQGRRDAASAEDRLWGALAAKVRDGDPAADSAIEFLIGEAIQQLTIAGRDSDLEAAFAAPAVDNPAESLESLFELPAFEGEDH